MVEDGAGEARLGVHLAAVWVAGYLTVVGAVLVGAGVDAGTLPAVVGAVVFLVVGWGLLAGADMVAPGPWGGRGWRWRLGWAGVVDLLGAGWLVAEAPLVRVVQGPHSLLAAGAVLWVGLVVAALPYVVLAGVVATGRSWWWPTWLVVLALVTVLVMRVAWVSDTEARIGWQLEAVGVTSNDVWLADVPGYRLAGWREPAYRGAPDPAPVGVFRYVPTGGHGPDIVVYADERAMERPLCGPDPVSVSVGGAVGYDAVSCVPDGEHRWYRRSTHAQQYVDTFDNATVRVGSTAGVPRDVLRRAAASVRPASYGEIERLLPEGGGPYRPFDHRTWMFFF